MLNHTSVLLQESINYLNIKSDGVYVDLTLGAAGHSSEILKHLSSKGTLICFDQDKLAIENAQKLFKNNPNVIVIKNNFANVLNELEKRGISKVDGFLFDLGVSSMQIDKLERGFSYKYDTILDMRMDQEQSLTARIILETYTEKELTNIFKKYGEEKYSRVIAKEIVKTRQDTAIVRSFQLNDLIRKAIGEKAFFRATGHPAKRIYQALRIEVNKELNVFEEALQDCFRLLNSKGRICVITFHSLEDRICKYYFKKYSELDESLKKLPVIPDEYQPKAKLVTNKAILPTEDEMTNNSRSKSAKLRVLEKL